MAAVLQLNWSLTAALNSKQTSQAQVWQSETQILGEEVEMLKLSNILKNETGKKNLKEFKKWIFLSQRLLLGGVHGAGEGLRQPVRPQVSQEEAPGSQQPGERNPRPEKVNSH